MMLNRWYYTTVALLISLMTSRSLPGQTLTQELIQETPAKLILQARESGDIVHGAILFHQGNIACAKCHRPVADQGRIGPDLSNLGSEVTDESIVESILQPSKVINKEYSTTNVLRSDGRIFTGVVVSEDEKTLVLRDAKNVSELITFEQDDIDEVLPGSLSIMPAELADQLKDRQEFLDLLRYVLDIKERGPEAESASASSLARRELSPEMRGHVLMRKLNCVACHQAKEADRHLLTTSAPDLRWSAKHLNPGYLAKFIAQPRQPKPGTVNSHAVMPQMMPHLDAATRSKSAAAMSAYLVSLDGNTFDDSAPTTGDLSTVSRGSDLFHSVGCAVCHQSPSAKASEPSSNDAVPLGMLGAKYSASALVEFLKNPHVARPSGRMPNMRLKHREAVDIANFLLQPKDGDGESPQTKFHVNHDLINLGKSLFKSLNCSQCHTGVDAAEPAMPTSLAMADLDLQQGCLSTDSSGKWPEYNLTDSERSQIREALKNDASAWTNEQSIDFNLTHFNCTACHQRGDLGGVTAQSRMHFQTTNLNLGEQGRIPPTLSGVGAKLNRKWMRDVMVNGRSIRPYMKTRMPQYGEQNIGHLIDLFQTTDKLPKTDFAKFKVQKEMREQGMSLAGNKGLNCVACHTYQYKISDTMPAVDLTEMTERLKKDWFYQYMLAPQKFSPNTVMPSFWPSGKAIRPDIVGTPEHQVEALWQYLIDGRQARAPRGVTREPLEIVVSKEARMLRRSYPGMTKRGIGVGYPGGVNLAFDAEQLRLATLWKGQFVDPSGVWYGQGHGKVRPMGKTISLTPGPELDDLQSPWIVDDGRPPKHHFKGYSLDEKRRPTFRYLYGNVEVEDFTTEIEDPKTKQVHLRRRIKMLANESTRPLAFRVMAEDAAGISADAKQVVGDRLRINIVSKHTAVMIDPDKAKRVFVPLTFKAGEAQELILDYRWE